MNELLPEIDGNGCEGKFTKAEGTAYTKSWESKEYGLLERKTRSPLWPEHSKYQEGIYQKAGQRPDCGGV